MASATFGAPMRMVLAFRPACARPQVSSSIPRCTLNPSLQTNQTAVRHASHQAQGRANGVKNGPGKRLGAKKTGGQQVVPGNIIFRQRGTLWFPGENCDMGRDHTIFATQPGYVTYYRDPDKHPKRQYIGVVFNRTQTLPTPPNAARRRRLGMVAVQRKDMIEIEEGQSFEAETAMDGVDASVIPPTIRSGTAGLVPDTDYEDLVPATRSLKSVPLSSTSSTVSNSSIPQKSSATSTSARPPLEMRPNYMYREANWSIGRTAEREGLDKLVRPYKKNDRFYAWRKSAARIKKNAEKRNLGRAGKAGKAKKKK